MELELRRQYLRHTYKVLGNLIECLEDLRIASLDAEDLEELEVTLSSLDISSKDPVDFEPRFFRPMPADEFNNTFDAMEDSPKWNEGPFSWQLSRYEEGNILATFLRAHLGHPLDEDSLGFKAGWGWGGHSSKTYRLLHEWPRQRSITQWSTNCFLFQMASHPDFGSWPSEALESSSPPPHIGCLISNDHLADNNQLLRSEVITASSLMREQMRQEPYWDNFLFPVFVFSCSGYNVRMLQVHYDYHRDVLAVRVTPYIRVDGHEMKNTKLILRHMLNIPSGETKFEALRSNEKSEDALPKTPIEKALRCI